MAIEFSGVTLPPLRGLSARAPSGAVIGIVGESGAGKGALLRLAAGEASPVSGTVTASEPRLRLGPGGALNGATPKTLALEHTLALHDAVARGAWALQLERLRRDGATVLLVSHEPALLADVCDELWWLHEGQLRAQGDPRVVLAGYAAHVAARVREEGGGNLAQVCPAGRRGDGRARLTALETRGSDGRVTSVWASGEPVSIHVRVAFEQPVDNPVVGIMIRNRIGVEVYGTNTVLENLSLGPCLPGEELALTFSFVCDLCPQRYTLTAASHDPDGVPHDWIDDAVAFSVVDTRYTAGVANLRARVTVQRS